MGLEPLTVLKSKKVLKIFKNTFFEVFQTVQEPTERASSGGRVERWKM